LGRKFMQLELRNRSISMQADTNVPILVRRSRCGRSSGTVWRRRRIIVE